MAEAPASPGNGEPLKAPPDFKGAADRRCTDVIFALLIIAMWVAMTAVGISSIHEGDVYRLINGMDYQGRICGKDTGVETKTKLYYIRFSGTGVCVESCPTATNWDALWGCTDDNAGYTSAEGYSCTGSNASTCLNKAGLTSASASGFSGAGDGVCMYQIESTDFLNHCVFSDESILDVFTEVQSDVSYMQEFLADVYTARNWILGFGFCFSMTLGFIYCLLLRVPGVVQTLVWTSILAIFALFIAIGYGFHALGTSWKNDGQHDDYQILACKILGIVGYVLAGLWFCLSMWMRKRIGLATGIIKESARAIGAIPTMILMPIVSSIGIVLFLIPWVWYCAYTASIGTFKLEEVAGIEVKTVTYADEIQYRGWYLLFCYFWSTQFISAMSQIVIALTIVKYYFSRDKGQLGSGTFFMSLAQGMWYHMGSAALGSLVIAIIEMIRAVIAYMQKKAKLSKNKVLEYALCCCACCFWCLEKCMKFMNKNAYIQVAIFSTSFCRSAKNAFWLIARNLARVGTVSVITDFICIIMKLVICLGTMGAVYLALKNQMEDKLYTEMGPSIFAGILAYSVACVFADLFNMASLTILQCFIADCEMFTPADRYADANLSDWVAKQADGAPMAGRLGEATPTKDRSEKGTPAKAKGTPVQKEITLK